MKELNRLKLRIGITDDTQDTLLRELLRESREFIMGYTRRDEDQWLPHFASVQIALAAAAFGRLGAEGVQSQSVGSVSTSFFGAEDLPASIKAALDSYRLIKGL
jgi:hypothetical protein